LCITQQRVLISLTIFLDLAVSLLFVIILFVIILTTIADLALPSSRGIVKQRARRRRPVVSLAFVWAASQAIIPEDEGKLPTLLQMMKQAPALVEVCPLSLHSLQHIGGA